MAMHEMEKKEKTEREQFLIFMGMDKDERKKMNPGENGMYIGLFLRSFS